MGAIARPDGSIRAAIDANAGTVASDGSAGGDAGPCMDADTGIGTNAGIVAEAGMDTDTGGEAHADVHTHADADAPTGTDAVILQVAAGQHGVISRSQLIRAGVPIHAIDYRLRTGRLRAVHRGVYRAGPVTAPLAREMAAILACGEGTVLSHRTAAVLWGMVPPPRRESPVEVTGPRTLRGPREKVRVHRVSRLDPDEIDRRHELPLTSPARTLLDLAARASPHEVERALASAERRGLVTRDAVEAVLARHPRRGGGRMLRAVLDTSGGPALTRSQAEARFLELVRRGAVSPPRANAVVEGIEVDFLWRSQRLVVEIDGFAYHRGRAAFERDRHRDGVLTAAGFRVLRITWRQLTDAPEATLVGLARALAVGWGERRGGGGEGW